MAHIPDGVLSAPVLIAGAVVSISALSVAIRRLRPEQIPQTAVLAAAFFVASLVNVPVGTSSVHLILNGLMGIILGWAAVPAILVALVLQAAFFGFGGIVVLGVNTMNIALPALMCALLLRRPLRNAGHRRTFWLGMAAGAGGTALTGVLLCLTIALSGPALLPAAKVIFLVFLPLIAVEALVTGFTLTFIRRVAPEMLFSPEVRYG